MSAPSVDRPPSPHGDVWEIRFRDPAAFARAVARLPAEPRTTFLAARAAQNDGRLDDTLQLCNDAEQGLREDPLWHARLLETRGNVLSAIGLSHEAQAQLAAAWRGYDECGDAVGRASVRQNIAVLDFQSTDTARALLGEALELAERAGRADLQGLILLNLAGVSEDTASLAQRHALVTRAHDLLADVWPEMATRARCFEADLALGSGDLAAAQAHVDTLPDLRDIRDRIVREHAARVRSELALALDDPSAAVAAVDEALAGQIAEPDRPHLLHLRFRALLAAGEHEQALAAAEEAFAAVWDVVRDERHRSARALDVWHRTAALQEERRREAQRADALEMALAELEKATARIHELSIRDAVTGLHNRPYLLEHLPPTGTPACVALVDLDHFKAVNDTYGHGVGDAVLRAFALALRDSVGPQDLVARYGGEEFVVVRSHAGDSLRADLDALCARLSARPLCDADGRELPRITLSAGVVTLAPAEDFGAALDRADVLLYEAKRSGRNHVRADRRAPVSRVGAP